MLYVIAYNLIDCNQNFCVLWTIYLMYFDHEKSYVRSIFILFYCFFNIIVQSLWWLKCTICQIWDLEMYIVDLDFFFFVFANCYQRLILTSCVSDVVHQRRVLTRRVSDVGHQRRAIRVSNVVTSQTRISTSVMRCYHRHKFTDAKLSWLWRGLRRVIKSRKHMETLSWCMD